MKHVRRLLLGLVAVAALLVVAAAALLLVIDEEALVEKYRATGVEALSETLGRDVRVGTVELTLFPTLALEARDAVIPPPAATPDRAPLLAIEALRLEIDVLKALVSLGEDIDVDEVVVVAPEAHVERAADGTWSFADIEAHVAARGEAAPAEGEGGLHPRLEALLSNTEVGRIAIEGGRVTVVDGAAGGGPARLTLEALDAEMTDVALGRPVALHVRGALGDAAQNLAITVETSALPKKLPLEPAPDIRNVSIFIDGVPVGALSGWLPEDTGFGLADSHLLADLRVAPLEDRLDLEGQVSLQDLRVTAADGATGETFDLTVRPDAELAMDLSTVVLEEDAAIEVAGSVIALSGAVRGLDEAPVLEAVRAEGPVDLQRLQAVLSRPGARPDAPQISGQGRLSFAADGPADRAAVSARVDLTDASLRIAEQLDKPAGTEARLEVKASLRPEAVRLSSWRLDLGALGASGSGEIGLGDEMRADVSFATRGVTVAALAELLPAARDLGVDEGKVAVDGRFTGPLTDPTAQRLAVRSLEAETGRSRLTGRGEIRNLSAPIAELRLESPRLDLDALLPPPTEEEQGPIEIPPILREIHVDARARVGEVLYGGDTYRNLTARVLLDDGILRVPDLGVNAFGGRLSANDSQVDLTEDAPRFDLRAQVENMAVAALLSSFTSLGRPLEGQLGAGLSVQGRGLEWAAISSSLSGRLEGQLQDGWVKGIDLAARVIEPLADRVALVDRSLVDLKDRAKTEFERLGLRVSFVDGGMRLRQPLQISTPFGEVALGGAIGFDRTLDLEGAYALSPSTIARLTRGRVKLDEPLPVGLDVGCTITDPCVESVDAAAAAKTLAAAAAQKVAKKAVDRGLDEAKQRARDKLEDAVGQKAEGKAADKAKDAVEKGLKGLFGD